MLEGPKLFHDFVGIEKLSEHIATRWKTGTFPKDITALITRIKMPVGTPKQPNLRNFSMVVKMTLLRRKNFLRESHITALSLGAAVSWWKCHLTDKQ